MLQLSAREAETWWSACIRAIFGVQVDSGPSSAYLAWLSPKLPERSSSENHAAPGLRRNPEPAPHTKTHIQMFARSEQTSNKAKEAFCDLWTSPYKQVHRASNLLSMYPAEKTVETYLVKMGLCRELGGGRFDDWLDGKRAQRKPAAQSTMMLIIFNLFMFIWDNTWTYSQ